MNKCLIIRFTDEQIEKLLRENFKIEEGYKFEHLSTIGGFSVCFSKELTEDQDEEKKRLLETKIEDISLSGRAFNCLRNSDINTLGDLTNHSKSDIYKIRLMGRKTLTELENLLKSNGLKFSEEKKKFS